jgi:hypothetical protein
MSLIPCIRQVGRHGFVAMIGKEEWIDLTVLAFGIVRFEIKNGSSLQTVRWKSSLGLPLLKR